MWSSKIEIFAVFLTILSLTQGISIKRENTLAPPYIANAENLLFWDFTGGAQPSGSFIRLTTDEDGKHGGIWNNFPVLFNNWEFQTHFHIHGKGVNLNGDGMALWYVRDTLHAGPVFGSKDYFSGLGVFIDTFENIRDPHKHRHPYISAMVNNGSLHYEHDEDGTATEIGGCHVPVRNLDVPTKIAISYINQNLAVYMDYEGTSQWKICFKALGVHLPTGYFLGVSASTSDVTDNHDVLAITTLNLDPPDKAWVDKSDVVPEAENVQIPEKYLKHLIEEREGLRKDEPKIQVEEEDEEEEEILDDEPEQIVRPDAEEAVKPKAEETVKPKVEETVSVDDEDTATSQPSTSLLRKLVYITGASVIVMVFISIYRTYAERRRERMHKSSPLYAKGIWTIY